MIRAILTDIEGTTSSISFVHDTLFPYARRRMADYVRQHAGEPAVAALLDEVRQASGQMLDTEGVIRQLEYWIDSDAKVTPLKALQGMIWEHGYRCADFTGHIYPDAAAQMRHWHAAGLKLYIFSSGSVQAQQLLFRYSDAGDLTPLLDGYFDTRTGNKLSTGSYSAIAQAIGIPAVDVLFLSDTVGELDAAQAAGMQTARLDRQRETPGNSTRPCFDSFAAIAPLALRQGT